MAKKQTSVSNSTQKYLLIQEMKDNCIVLRDGSLRAILLVSSINFALKGEDEQNAIISAYVSFLNNLNFPLQIVIQSRNLNINSYLAKLKELEKGQQNELLRMQIADYQSFLSELLELGQIMTKKFYVSVPYSGVKHDKKKFFEQAMEAFSPARIVRLSEKRFQKNREELFKRVEGVMGGLSSIGLSAQLLDTQGLIELFYDYYNPEIATAQKVADINELRID